MPANIPWPPPPIAHFPATNIDNPTVRSWLPAYAITLHIVSTLMVLVRYFLRAQKRGGGLGSDDALLLPAWMFAGAVIGLASWSSNAGLIDRHFWDIQRSRWDESVAYIWLGIVLFIIGTCLLRCSVLLFYRRIQANVLNVRWITTTWAAFWFALIYCVGIVLALDLMCQPTQALWKSFNSDWQEKNPYTCSNILRVNLIAGIISTAGDAFIFLLPCFMLRGLEISARQRRAVYSLFALNVAVVAAGCGRTWALYGFSSSLKGDESWYGWWIYFWSMTEYELAIMAVCAPSVRILFTQVLRQQETEESRHTILDGWAPGVRSGNSSTLTFGRRSLAVQSLHKAVFGTGINSMSSLPAAWKKPASLGTSRLKCAPIWTPEGSRLARQYGVHEERFQAEHGKPMHDQSNSEPLYPAPVVTITCATPLPGNEEDGFNFDAARTAPDLQSEKRQSVVSWPPPRHALPLESRVNVVPNRPSDARAMFPWIFGVREFETSR